MQRCWGASLFMNFLNNRVCSEHGKIQSRNGQKLHDPKEFFYKKEVGVVIIGFCASLENEASMAWLWHTLDGMKLEHVLMFAGCCGTYTRGFQKSTRGIFSDYIWLFPDMHDLRNDIESDHAVIVIVQYLMNAGVIGLC